MSATGWILATGALTLANDIALRETQAIDFVKVPAATVAAVGLGALISQVSPELATILAVTAFVTVTLAPVSGRQAPITTVFKIFERIGVK